MFYIIKKSFGAGSKNSHSRWSFLVFLRGTLRVTLWSGSMRIIKENQLFLKSIPLALLSSMFSQISSMTRIEYFIIITVPQSWVYNRYHQLCEVKGLSLRENMEVLRSYVLSSTTKPVGLIPLGHMGSFHWCKLLVSISEMCFVLFHQFHLEATTPCSQSLSIFLFF